MENLNAATRTTIRFADLLAPDFYSLELDGATIEASANEELAMDLLAGIEAQVRTPEEWLWIAEAARDPETWRAVAALAESKAEEARRIEASRQ